MTRAPLGTSAAASGWSRSSCGDSSVAKRFGEPRHVLGDVDQRHGEIARRAEHREAERADQHDVARRRPSRLPEQDRPGEQRQGPHDDDERVQQAQLFKIAQAAPARVHFLADRRVEPQVLAENAAERAHQRHVADDVDHFAIDRRRLAGEIAMQGPPAAARRNMAASMAAAVMTRRPPSSG